jgi:hypothetical protein
MPVSTALKTPRDREAQIAPASVEAPAVPAPDTATEPVAVYRPDSWGFLFWLGCAAVLVLLHLLDWLGALLGR